tara:strand:- start:82396 stop:85773 length:3378 start_codon:yes stop_codon:yes gene_type:complete
MIRLFALILCSTLFIQCSNNADTSLPQNPLFSEIHPSDSNIDFQNILTPTEEYNMYIFRNFYNGSGVAVGDLTGNGLPDIFLTGNMTSNRLYENKGNYEFVDITDQAGLNSDGYWSTGASIADINGNGLLDIFVTLSGEPIGEERHNRLYFNNGDGTFTEASKEWGVADDNLSTHAVFFDYNNDGLLDFYLISNSFHEVGEYDNVTGEQRQIPDPLGSSKLYRNEGDKFTDVTQEAGIYSSIIGFGLSASVSDINRDGCPDLYIANDFFERDYLYINNCDGTFSESLDTMVRSLSHSSMGSDIADINNDGWPDIYVSDMRPEDEVRMKSKMTIESWDEYQNLVERGFHHKFTRNTLQLNRGDNSFSEVGRYSNVYATDWSWAVLMADYDLNGYNDIFVANGIYKDLLDQDYIDIVSNPRIIQERIQAGETDVILSLMDQMSSTPIRNYLFNNEGDLDFTDRTVEWGLGKPGYTSGAAWADLNGNGALDLIINNVNGPAQIYRNNAPELYPQRNWLRVELLGESPNTQGIGAQLQVWADGEFYYREHFLQRGFQSSVEPGLHVGLSESTRIDSLILRWPDGRSSRVRNLDLPAKIILDQSQSESLEVPPASPATLPGDLLSVDTVGFQRMGALLEETEIAGLSGWKHIGFDYNDFSRERLLMQMKSTEGPALCSGDVNGDGLEDIYTGGARDQAGTLWLQQYSGGFLPHQQELFDGDAISEDVDCQFFDATGNGVDDLYVVSGGNSFSSSSSALIDRLYLNNGNAQMNKSEQMLPSWAGFHTGSVVAAHDFTGDGIQDLFVGTRLRPFAVGLPVNGYLLTGDGQGGYEEVTSQWSPTMESIGMITDALWADLTGDGLKELIVVGEWMPIRVFANRGSRFDEITDELGLSNTTGWWNAIAAGDLNGDGRIDLIGANHGHNSIFRATDETPVKMWVGDFSKNGMTEQILSYPKNGEYYPVALRHDLIQEIPHLREKYPDYASYAGQSIDQIFSEEELSETLELTAEMLSSVVIWNQEDGMQIEKLPPRTQMAPMYGIALHDLNGNGLPEVIMGGNLYDVKPQSGPYDASHGVALTYREGGLHSLSPSQSGINIPGEIRNILPLSNRSSNRLLLFARYNKNPVILRSKK